MVKMFSSSKRSDELCTSSRPALPKLKYEYHHLTKQTEAREPDVFSRVLQYRAEESVIRSISSRILRMGWHLAAQVGGFVVLIYEYARDPILSQLRFADSES